MSTLKSMTAYARHEDVIGAKQCTWELRSVNHRYLDAHFRLPEKAQALEQKIREELAARVTRGRVDVSLSLRNEAMGQSPATVNAERLAQWGDWQDQVRSHIPEAQPLSVMQILGDSDIFEAQVQDESLDEKALLASFNQALDGLLQQRLAEGGRLKTVLEQKLQAIAEITRTLTENISTYEQAHQANWQARVDKLTGGNIDPLRLHQELALLISKADVTEELDRLVSHISEFDAALQGNEPVGRRLDFLLQEFNREANTLGSKSIHQEITNASVELKVLIDQLREQIQNIE